MVHFLFFRYFYDYTTVVHGTRTFQTPVRAENLLPVLTGGGGCHGDEDDVASSIVPLLSSFSYYGGALPSVAALMR